MKTLDDHALVSFTVFIFRNTVAMVASAPQYPHGVMDPVEAIASLGCIILLSRNTVVLVASSVLYYYPGIK